MANPKILLLPGLDGDGFYLAALRDMLARDYTCELLSYPKQTLNYENLCAWVCDHMDFDSDYIIVAESFGGPVGIRIAEVLEHQVKGLVLCATFCEPPQSGFILSCLAGLYPRFIHFGWMAHVLNFLLFNGSNSGFARRLHHVLMECPAQVITYRLRLLGRFDMRAASAALELPCLVIKAARDRMLRSSRFSHLRSPIFATIDGPHELGGSRTAEIAKLVLDFVRTLPAD